MFKEITGRTGLLCLLGSPVGHSISPQMHNEACRITGEDLRYLAFDVGVDELETAVKGLLTLGVRGFNLTMPVKNAMAALCDELSLLPVRIDPEFVCSIHDRHPFFRWCRLRNVRESRRCGHQG